MSRLEIQGLRCIRNVAIGLEPGLNWFFGANGSGKTTLLEAIYLLDRGRTFRGRRAGPLVAFGSGRALVEGLVVDGGVTRRVIWGSDTRVDRRQGEFVRFVGASTFSLIEGEARLRRSFFDWCMLHAQPASARVLSDANRLYAQRNAWLKSGGAGHPIWDVPLACAVGRLNSFRLEYLKCFGGAFRDLTREFLACGGLLPVWSGTVSQSRAEEILRRSRVLDVRRGFSSVSPARGDVRFLRDGERWCGSRGENKLAGILLQLAAQVVGSAFSSIPVALVDDPFSEVDGARVSAVLREWSKWTDQLIVASLFPPTLRDDARSMFHVERGAVSVSRPL